MAFYAASESGSKRVISDNAFAYRHSAVFRGVIDAHGITQKFIRHTVPGPAARRNASTAASPIWVNYYSPDRTHPGIGEAKPPSTESTTVEVSHN
jgi:hypothetical protein